MRFSKTDVVLVSYPFADRPATKVRPAIVVSTPSTSGDLFVVPLTTKVDPLVPGEFLLREWRAAGLNKASAVKRGVYTVHFGLILKKLGQISTGDARQLDETLRTWLGL